MSDDLRAQIALAKQHERHHTNAATAYWCEQYKLLCDKLASALAEKDAQIAALHGRETLEQALFRITDATIATSVLARLRAWLLTEAPSDGEPFTGSDVLIKLDALRETALRETPALPQEPK